MIPAATRQRILRIAAELGYRADPTLQALMAYRRSRGSHGRQDTLACLVDGELRCGGFEAPAQAGILAGASRRAAALGYQLEAFRLGVSGLSPSQLNQTLSSQGITGALLVADCAGSSELAAIDWARLSAVRVGRATSGARLRQVTYDPCASIQLAMRHIIATGYERIGLVMPRWWNTGVDLAWSAGFLAEQAFLPASAQIPILGYGDDRTATPGAATEPVVVPRDVFEPWFVHHRPDVIVSHAPFVRPTLAALGLSCPEDVAYADLFLHETAGTTAGIFQNCERIGELAVDVVVDDIRQFVRGAPAVPTATLVSGTWIEGATLPCKDAAHPAAGSQAATVNERSGEA